MKILFYLSLAVSLAGCGALRSAPDHPWLVCEPLRQDGSTYLICQPVVPR